jgi:hypothetical protein
MVGSLAPGEAAAQAWHETAAVGRQADREVQQLPEPPAQARTITRLVSAYFEEANGTDAIGNAYAGGRLGEAQALERAWSVAVLNNAAVARTLGMFYCAKVGSPGIEV